jgi:cellulose synthase/poly-beta-1,6-N-acetylglucosamine synthase-like glycosyltransferase
VVAAPHQGFSRSLASALGLTRGTYLGWVDSDDRLRPTALAATVAVLNQQPTIGMVYTDYDRIDIHNQVLGRGIRCAILYQQCE